MKNKENIMKTKQLNLWPGGYKKQKWNRGNPLTKKDKLYRIHLKVKCSYVFVLFTCFIVYFN